MGVHSTDIQIKVDPKRKELKVKGIGGGAMNALGRAAAILGVFVSFVVFVVAAAMTDPQPVRAKQAESQPPAPATASQEQPEASVQHSDNESSPTPRDKWNVHEFKVVSDKDISSRNRFRRRITILGTLRTDARRSHCNTH